MRALVVLALIGASAQPRATEAQTPELVEAVHEAERAYRRQADRRVHRRRGPAGRLSASARRFVTLGERYLEHDPDSDAAVTLRYRLARVFYEADSWREAAVRFEWIALSHPDHELAEYAANLYLDSLWQLGAREEIWASLNAIESEFCATSVEAARHPDVCSVLAQLGCDRAVEDVRALEREERWAEAGRALIRFARRQTECGQIDEVLYDAARNYVRAAVPSFALRIFASLLHNYAASRLAPNAQYWSAELLAATGQERAAADAYLRFAEDYPTHRASRCRRERSGICPDAIAALEAAVELFGQLDDRESLVRTATLLEQLRTIRP